MDEGFVAFDDLASAAERRSENAVLLGHGFPDAVAEEPGGFHGALQDALNLARADPLLGSAHQMDDLQPQMQRQMRAFEDGPLADRELPAAGIALVKAEARRCTVHASYALNLATVSAHRAIRPQFGFHIGERGFFILQVRGGKSGLGHGNISYGLHPICGAGFVKCNIACAALPEQMFAGFRLGLEVPRVERMPADIGLTREDLVDRPNAPTTAIARADNDSIATWT